ncbi:hypothetical protein JMN32_18160 [Fulvivirga sp. 29W222]|uniref:Uncharacterized protein n=1 Tax=Fulvivirga marina TaxID=2494733 RepID=A0A937FY95_9BACT|nr:hypothetical protein [Fulvivirga marina]MBL6448244.1 hypothetical protein [Fulvivirga marina]
MRETQEMVTEQTRFDLIKGVFTPEEAHEIMTNLLMKKINFHEMRDLSQQIRFGLKDETSLQRIEELKASLVTLQELVKKAKLSERNLKLESNLSVEFI